MSAYQRDLAYKKQRLLIRSGDLRRQLSEDVTALRPVFTFAGYVEEGMLWVRTHPMLIAGALVVAVIARPRPISRWVHRGWLAWLAWRRLTRPSPASENSLIGRVSRLFSI